MAVTDEQFLNMIAGRDAIAVHDARFADLEVANARGVSLAPSERDRLVELARKGLDD